MKIFGSLCTAAMAILIASPVFGDVIAFEDFDSDSNLLNFETSPNVPAGGFTNFGDGFQEFQRRVSATIPFNLSDDSVEGGAAGSDAFADDSNGPVGAAKTDIWFGITDTWNGVTGNTEVTGTWSFDISSATEPLTVSADMVAMNDFAGSTVDSNVDFFYQIDGGGFNPLFTSSISFGESQAYTMDDGDEFIYSDPLNMNGVRLTNVFQTISSGISGNGAQLDIQVRVNMDGSESFAFDNLRVSTASVPEPGSVAFLGLMGLVGLRRRR